MIKRQKEKRTQTNHGKFPCLLKAPIKYYKKTNLSSMKCLLQKKSSDLNRLYRFIKKENISLKKLAILLELSTREDIEKCRKFG